MRLKLDPVYAVAKSFGIRGQILPFQFLEELAESRNLSEYVDKLRITPYGQHLAGLPKPYDQLAIEKMLRRHLIDVHYKLMSVVPKAELLSVYFYRYVAANMKAVLRAKAMGKSFEEIQAGLDLYAEELLKVRDEIIRAATAPSAEEAVEELKRTFLVVDATLAYQIWMEKKDLSILDAAIDRAVYEKIVKAFKKTPRRERKSVKEFISLEIDGYQILTILRAKTWEIPSPQIKMLILDRTYNIPKDNLEEMIEAEDFEEAFQILSETHYSRFIKAEARDRASILRELEEAFRREIYKTALRMYRLKPFSLGVVLSTIILKELEVRNLTTIAIGLSEGLAASNIIQNLYRLS